MSDVDQPERATQDRVIALFRDELGYRYIGDRADRCDNSNIEEHQLSAWLTKFGYTSAQISAALHKLRTEADNHSRALYGSNQAVYSLLRYGVPVKTEAGTPTETIHLINWRVPEQSDFAIAEEVTPMSSIASVASASMSVTNLSSTVRAPSSDCACLASARYSPSPSTGNPQPRPVTESAGGESTTENAFRHSFRL